MYKVKTSAKEFNVNFLDNKIILDDQEFQWDLSKLQENNYHVIKNDVSYNVEVASFDPEEKEIVFKINGRKYPVKVQDKLDLLLEKLGIDKASSTKLNDVKAPMPGLILSIEVSEGQEVKKGDPLLILEAMKMENVIKAPGDGTVKSIVASQGDSVEKNQVIIQF
ncbi:MAG: biotin/lipoyl-binding protein [Cytophagales bacterium]|nr:biotin/lipoyl-binding protein [Cytophagales bacterium]